jgi:predicted Zn-dependent protease
MAFKENAEMNARLHRVMYPLEAQSADLCPKTGWRTGVQLQTLDRIAPDLRPLAREKGWASDNITVFSVVPGSPADAAGLKVGDVLTKVNGSELAKGDEGLKQLVQVTDGANGAAVELTVTRGAEQVLASVTPIKQCSYAVAVVNQPVINAFADGDKIMVTKGMMRFAQTDEELALVLGHEMAHNARGHVDAKRGNELAGVIIGSIIGGLLGAPSLGQLGGGIGGSAYSQEFEYEADYVGLYMMARGGYAIDNSASFWRRMAMENPQGISTASTHPTTPDRFVSIDAAIAEIKGKQAAGTPLVPNEMPKPPPTGDSQFQIRK